MAYKLLIFDADRTLFDFDQSERIAFKNFLNDIGKENDFSSLFPIYIEKNEETWRELEQGLISQDKLKIERFKRFMKASNIQGDPQNFTNIYTQYLANASILYEDAYEIIEYLSKKYKIVIVTNGLKEVQNKRIRNSVLKPFIELTVISDEIKIMKPDPKIIDHTLKLINHHNKDDIIIIGDSLSSDIQCGFNAGIDTIWFNPNKNENTLDNSPTYTITKLKDLFNIL
ncbi:noncanonical pyrimidine nucleotidase, YjjG family [Hujiaoplasma nucleasis]|uniref:Noncanonical pyrimidine nucleotidase, YjjG family n=1 Tax=Hujiaoplasma nucleasis TaxID=2725268 RepID=A0A7L6N5P4_9MOLU|nr:YjjG family noncanonical pyrimidine nucleotidase [Hujiaoplasma nucleasis]QLY40568.1 noncanonical pyrimidine nucleotidase, YjjG family [Hujiaoplasma nucleasis]